MKKLLIIILLAGLPLASQSQTISKVTSFMQLMQEMEEGLPENWEMWDWQMINHPELNKLPVVMLEFAYRTPGLKEISTSVQLDLYDLTEKEKCTKFYEKHQEKGDQLVVFETKGSVGFISYSADAKRKKEQKKMVGFLKRFYGEHANDL